MNIRIDYYTGTGGSKLIADRIAKELVAKGNRVKVNRIIRDQFVVDDDFEYYLLLFAVHSFNAPAPVFEWVAQLQGEGRRCGVVAVSGAGETITNTASRREIIAALQLKSFEVIYEEMVRMPNNWMAVPSEEKCKRLLMQMPVKCEEIANAIFEQRQRRTSPYWIDIAITEMGKTEKLFTAKFGQGIKTTEACTGCGLCAKRCCSSNITIKEGKASFGNRCDMCLGCLYGCPHQALIATKAGFQVDKKGYDLAKMMRQ